MQMDYFIHEMFNFWILSSYVYKMLMKHNQVFTIIPYGIIQIKMKISYATSGNLSSLPLGVRWFI